MPRYATEQDELVERVIDAWHLTAREEIETIGGWRETTDEDRERRYWSGRSRLPFVGPPKMPRSFEADTSFLYARLVTWFPSESAEPLQLIREAVAAWHRDHDARSIMPQPQLELTLDRADELLLAARQAIRDRLVYGKETDTGTATDRRRDEPGEPLTETHGEAATTEDRLAAIADDVPLAPRTLAELGGVPLKALQKRLERMRAKEPCCGRQVDDAGPRDPRFLYFVGKARPHIQALRLCSPRV